MSAEIDFSKYEDDDPQLNDFFIILGRLTIAWGHLEAGIDTCNMHLHHRLGNPSGMEVKRHGLRDKIKFFRKSIDRILKDSPKKKEYFNLVDRIRGEMELRHWIIHGFVCSHDGTNSVFGKYPVNDARTPMQERTISSSEIVKSYSRIRQASAISIKIAIAVSKLPSDPS